MRLNDLLSRLPQQGVVEWIGVRPARRVAPVSVQIVQALAGKGLTGDRFNGGADNKRQVTLIQAEHLEVIAALMRSDTIDPGWLRRNLVIRGINLLALNGAHFRVGTAILAGTGGCHPCSRMEEALGEGGYNAMRGHGGITARVLESGVIRIGDPVVLVRPGTLAARERE